MYVVTQMTQGAIHDPNVKNKALLGKWLLSYLLMMAFG
jgi:hypothetical protein